MKLEIGSKEDYATLLRISIQMKIMTIGQILEFMVSKQPIWYEDSNGDI